MQPSILYFISFHFARREQATTMAGAIPCIMMIRYSGGLFGPYALYAFTGGCLAAVTGPNIRSVLM